MSAECKIAELTAHASKTGRNEKSRMQEALEVVREANLYRPDLFIRFGNAIRALLSKTSVEYWDLTEDMALSAADRGAWPALKSLLHELTTSFPDSWRVKLIEGRADECHGLFNAALNKYVQLVAKDPLTSGAYKRQVAVLKAQRRNAEAVSLLNHYVSLFRGDAEAWAELCALCANLGRFEHALFCANELVVLEPDNYAAHLSVADIHVTMGGTQNYLSARRHYAASLGRKRRGNTRALYGMWLAAKALADEGRWKEASYDDGYVLTGEADGERLPRPPQSAGEKEAENAKAIAWSRDALMATYRAPASPNAENPTKGKERGMSRVVRVALE